MCCQILLCQPCYLPEQCLAPLTAHDRPDLEHAFGTFWEPIDTSHEHFLDCIRHRHSRRPGREPPLAILERNGPCFTQRGHQLFDEEGDSLGFVEHEPDQIVLDMGCAEQS